MCVAMESVSKMILQNHEKIDDIPKWNLDIPINLLFWAILPSTFQDDPVLVISIVLHNLADFNTKHNYLD